MLNQWARSVFELPHATHKAILPMEGIRGFAVFLVFLVHYVSLVGPYVDKDSSSYLVLFQLHNIGNIGVDLFFVLSGYLIYGMLIRKKRPFISYIARRIQRVYPVFSAVFVIYIILSLAFPEKSKIPISEDWTVYLFQNFLLMPGIFNIEPMITVAWSLSYEFFYYLTIPLVIEILRMRSWAPKSRAIFILFASILLFIFFANYGGHIRLIMFLAGILLFDIIEGDLIPRIPSIGLPSILVAVCSVVLLNQFDANGWWNYVFLYILFLLFLLECFTRMGFASRIFSALALRWLGSMSYSYYLLHGLALQFVFLVLGKVSVPSSEETYLVWFLLPLAFFFTLVPSIVMFVVIEKPFSLVQKPTPNDTLN
jgi:exopolysaccharide production protein ExoZ